VNLHDEAPAFGWGLVISLYGVFRSVPVHGYNLGVRFLKALMFTAALSFTAGFVYNKFRELEEKNRPKRLAEDLGSRIEDLERKTEQLSYREPI